MLKRLRKLETGDWYSAANYKNDQNSNITANELQLVTQIILLLESFCSKGVNRAPQSQEIKKNENDKHRKSQVKIGVFDESQET